MTELTPRRAVLLLAYGGPDSLEDIPAYLLDIRGGRHTPQHLVDEITARYALIGGRSPLLDITCRTAAKLEDQTGLPVYVGMRHWTPFIADTVARMAADGIDHIIAICMAPHYSALSIGKYRQKLEEALAANDRVMSFTFVEQWYTQPAYLQGIADNVRQTLGRWPESERELVKVIFSAHSLPAYIVEQGDPYDAQLRETASLLARQLALPDDRWTFSYQSAAQTGVPWLGPQIEELIVQCARSGDRDLLVAPIGFIADHVEILYDLDIGVQRIAQEHGVRVERPPMLNDSQPLIEALASLVQESQ
jgi:ferrochelatase